MEAAKNRAPKLSWSRRSSGFTLVEIMIGMVLAGLLLAGVALTLNMWARSSMSLGKYADMSGNSRRASGIFAYDVRHAKNVLASTSSTFAVTAYGSSNSIVNVTYSFDADANTLTRNYGSVSFIILDDLEQFGFSYLDLNRSVTTDALSVKVVQIEAVLPKEVLNLNNTDEIISARFMLRNRRVST